MPEFRDWASSFTPQAPPSRRTRNACEHHHSNKEWELWRPRIEELWQEHRIKGVKEIIEQEGFLASEKQLRNHLDAWGGNEKYHSPQQKDFIYCKLVERSRQQKHTAFRSKKSKIKIPSTKIWRIVMAKQRQRRPGSGSYHECWSMTGTVLSSHGISAFTSHSRGIMLSPEYDRYSTPKRRRGGGLKSQRSPAAPPRSSGSCQERPTPSSTASAYDGATWPWNEGGSLEGDPPWGQQVEILDSAAMNWQIFTSDAHHPLLSLSAPHDLDHPFLDTGSKNPTEKVQGWVGDLDDLERLHGPEDPTFPYPPTFPCPPEEQAQVSSMCEQAQLRRELEAQPLEAASPVGGTSSAIANVPSLDGEGQFNMSEFLEPEYFMEDGPQLI